MALVNGNGFKNFQPSIMHGPIYSRDYDSDGSLWLPAVGGLGGFAFLVGTWTATRAAGGDYFQALTAAANSPIFTVDFSQIFDKIGTDPIASMPGFHNGALEVVDGTAPAGTLNSGSPGVGRIKVNDSFPLHIMRGVMLTAYDVVFTIGTAALTTHTGTCFETTYDNAHAAGQVVTKDAAQALGSTTNANVQLSSCTIVTPYILGNNASSFGVSNVADYLEVNITNPGTAVYHLYGVRIYFNYCIH